MLLHLVGRAVGDPGIRGQRDFALVGVLVLEGGDRIASRGGPGAEESARAADHAGSGREPRRGLAGGPQDPIDPATLGRGNGGEELARSVSHLKLEVAHHVAPLGVVDDGSAAFGAHPGELVVSVPAPAAAKAAPVEEELPGAGGKKREIGIEDLGGQGPQRRDVIDHVKAPSMSGEHHVVVARMHRDIAHRNHRKAARELRPLLPSVDGKEQAGLRPEEEQICIDHVLLDHVREALGFRGRERCPGLAEVGGLRNMSAHVAGHVAVESGEGRGFVVGRGFDP